MQPLITSCWCSRLANKTSQGLAERESCQGLYLSAVTGCPHYWVIDPAEASVRIWELVSRAYRLVVHAHGDEHVTVSEPLHLSFTVNDLIRHTKLNELVDEAVTMHEQITITPVGVRQ